MTCCPYCGGEVHADPSECRGRQLTLDGQMAVLRYEEMKARALARRAERERRTWQIPSSSNTTA